MKETNDIQINKNFSLKEFECPCCHCVMLDPKLLDLLIKLRLSINRPIYINSGYRCKKENDNVGGTKYSYHTYGMAADVTVKDMFMPDLAKYAENIGFFGIGLYNTFLHLDIRPNKYRWEDLS